MNLRLKPTGQVTALCPDCESLANFDNRGAIAVDGTHEHNGARYARTVYLFHQCSGCGRGALAKLHDNGNMQGAVLETFFPFAIDKAQVPVSVPPDVLAEFREAETCASFKANRAASALLRSTLEKTLRANGYANGSLQAKIDAAANDGVLTEGRRIRAHNEIRALGNDVLHDDWRAVTDDEVEAAHHYTQRVLEDLYDDRATVEGILRAKNRLADPVAPANPNA
jgi:hypothetical protein